LYNEGFACEQLLNETYDNMTAQNAAKDAQCNGVSSFDEVGWAKCQAAIALLMAKKEIFTNQTVACQNISQPCSGLARGTCNVTSGNCTCTGGWFGLQCENEPSAVVNAPGGFSKEGCSITGLDLTTGAAITGCTSIGGEFGMMTETVEPPPFESDLELNVNLPRVMTLEELIETLQDMSSQEYIIPIGWFLLMIVLFKLARKYDDSNAYQRFFPAWHECLTRGNHSSAMLKILGAQLVIVLCTNTYLMVLFILPTLPFGRSHRLMSMFIVLHAKLAILALFYGGQTSPAAAYIAQALDILIGLFFQQLSIQVFMFALIKQSDLGAVQAVIEKKAKRERERQRWVLAFRQTVPRSKARAAKAFANWDGDDKLLLQDKQAPQYYDPHTLLRRAEDFRDTRSAARRTLVSASTSLPP
jgi:hypothetical protein